MSGSLAKLWSARSVAVVGVSARDGSLGRMPVEFLLRYGYTGRILPVNPRRGEVLGLPVFTSLAEVREPVELAMIMLPAAAVADAVADCVAAGVTVAIVCSSGFAETGPAGRRAQEELVDIARAGGLRLVGPNCIGAVGVADGLVASFSPLFSGERTELVPGSLGFVSQSGALGYGAVSLAFERGLGLGWVVNTGNEADVTAVEVLAELAENPVCTAVLGYLESLTDITALYRLAAAGKPVALLKAGDSDAGARAAASHTGALATGDRVTDAVLRRLNVVRVSDVDDLLDVGDAFGSPYRPRGPRLGVVTTSGGSGILAADAVDHSPLTLAVFGDNTIGALDAVVPPYGATGNPVDVTATVLADPTLFDRCLDLIAGDPGVDMVLACFCVLAGRDVDGVVAGLRRVAQRAGKPVLVARTGAEHLAPKASAALRAAGIPAYPTPARAVRAAAALWQVSQPRVDRPAPVRGGPVPTVGASEVELKSLLRQAKLPVPASRLVASAADAAAAVREVGGRAVLKAVVPGLLHKTEAGGVVLDVDVRGAREVFNRLSALGGAVLVEEQVSGGVELLVGIAPSPLGPMLTLGMGGALTEVLDDVVVSPLPLCANDVRVMLGQLRAAALLGGVRGRPATDVDALVDMVVRLTELVWGWPAGFELDLNPVVVLPHGDGVRILDAAYVAPPEV